MSKKYTNTQGQKHAPLKECIECATWIVEYEVHSLIECPLYKGDRHVFFKDITKNDKNFYSLRNKEKCLFTMPNKNDNMLLIKLSNF